MGTGLSLDAIKKQYNLPENSSVADIIKFATDNDIVINFTNNNQNFVHVDNSNTSVWENTFNISDGSLFNTNRTGNSSLLNISQNNNSVSSSVFGFSAENNTFLDNKHSPFFESQVITNASNAGGVNDLIKNTDNKNQKFKLHMSNFVKGLSATTINNFLEESLNQADATSLENQHVDNKLENTKIVRIEISQDNTRLIKTLEDGSKREIELSEQEQAQYSQMKDKVRIVSTDFVDGKAVMKFADGKTVTRDAMLGERGYIKDGNSFQEELTAHFENYSNATQEEKQNMIKSYITDVFLNLSPEDREKKFKELLKNTDKSSESGKYLLSVVKNFGRAMRKEMQARIIQTRESVESQQSVVQVAVSDAFTIKDETSEQQRDNIDDVAELSQNYGMQNDFVKQAAKNIGNVHDVNAEHVTTKAIDMNSELATSEFSNVVKKSTNTEKAILDAVNGDEELANKVKTQCLELAGDIKNAHISIIGEDVITICNDELCKQIDAALLDGDVKIALKKVEELDLSTLSDGQAEGIHDGFNSAIRNGDIDSEHAKEVADIMVGTEVLVSDAERQAKMITNRNESLESEDVNPEIRDTILAEQGSKGHNYHEDNQLYADESARKIDKNGVYNLSVADNVHNYKNADIQNIIGQRVMDSNDEQALNLLANHVYDMDESNQNKFINRLKSLNYDSVNETLNKAEQRYNELKSQTSSSSDDNSSEIESTSSKEEKITNSSKISMKEAVEKIVSNNRLNISQKAIKIKGITNKEQQKLAISKIVETSTLPEVKNLILSGLKSEVFDYLLSNVSSENMTTLDSIKQFMQPQHVKRYNEILESRNSNEYINNTTNAITHPRRNLFIS